MALSALLMCREQQSLRMLAMALEEFEIEHEVCLSAPEAMEMMVQGHYSALVLDFDLPKAGLVAKMARMAESHRRPVIFAMIGALTAIGGTFRAGANFVLYKPLVLDQVMRSLRAGRGFMRPDRRRLQRRKLEAVAYLQFGAAPVPVMVLDVNEQGFSLQAPEPLPPLKKVPLRFVLPGSARLIEGSGEMIWADDSGRVGMLFSQLTPASRKNLKQWLGKRGSQKKSIVRTPTRSEKGRAALSVSH